MSKNDYRENIPEAIKPFTFLSKEELKIKLPILLEFYKNTDIEHDYISYTLRDNFLGKGDYTLVQYFKEMLTSNNEIVYKQCLQLLSSVNRTFLGLLRAELEYLSESYVSKNDLDIWYSPKRYLNILEYNLPIDSYDFEAVKLLSKKTKSELKKIVPELAFWLFDANSPIYGDMALLLSEFQSELLPEFEKVFNRDDNTEKHFCLMFMNHYIDINAIRKIKPILEKFANNPTEGEIEEDVHLYAKELLKKLNNFE